MRKSLLIVVSSFFLFTACYSNKSPEQYQNHKNLATHETIARFDGLKYKKCMGRTSECPDKCGKSGEIATFTILEYTKFNKTGKYGAEQKQFHVQLTDFNRKPLEGIYPLPSNIRKGDKVILNWNHDYVTKNHSSYPIYPVTKIEKLP
jgi:hypothetical protein